MATLTYPQLKTLIATLITTNKVSYDTFSVTRDNVVALVDKIGKIFDLDTNFRADKLSRFNAEYLSFGKTIEEWQADLILPENYDSTGAGAMSPAVSSFRPNFYSYTIGRKRIKQTIPYNDIERAVHNAGEFANIVARLYSRIEDSQAQYEYGLKREMAGKLASMAYTAGAYTASSTYESANGFNLHKFSGSSITSTTYSFNTSIILGNGQAIGDIWDFVDASVRYVQFQSIPTSTVTTLADLVDAGVFVPVDLVSELAKPTDATSGENFIESVKAQAEIASDRSSGHSLNGNALGVTGDLVLLVKQGILPNLEVKTQAGAFHLEKLALPAEVIALPDFGNADDDIYAILMDGRGMGLYPTYNATRENQNGDGDFLNVFRHSEFTAQISRNTFVHIWKVPASA